MSDPTGGRDARSARYHVLIRPCSSATVADPCRTRVGSDSEAPGSKGTKAREKEGAGPPKPDGHSYGTCSLARSREDAEILSLRDTVRLRAPPRPTRPSPNLTSWSGRRRRQDSGTSNFGAGHGWGSMARGPCVVVVFARAWLACVRCAVLVVRLLVVADFPPLAVAEAQERMGCDGFSAPRLSACRGAILARHLIRQQRRQRCKRFIRLSLFLRDCGRQGMPSS